MTTEAQQAPATRASGRVHGNPWHPTFRGVALATWIELLRRRPSAKGYVFYGVTVAMIIGLGVLAAVNSGPGKNSVAFELVLILILGAGMLIGPSLSATSINGDSSEGVLAPLQMTRLSAGDLAFGKLFASWLVCLAALVTTTPLLVYAYTRSGWTFGEAAAVVGMILFVVLAFTAVGLAWSSIAARAVASVSLTHLTTGMFVLGTLLLFAFTLPLVSETVTVINREPDYSQITPEQEQDPTFDYSTLPCIDVTYEQSIAHTEKTAWMLLINPVVMVAEASPVINPETYEQDGRAEPGLFAMIHQSVSGARLGPMDPIPYDACSTAPMPEDPWMERQREEALLAPNPWLGLGASGVLLLGSLWIVVRRLRVPYKKLRSGTRVA
jgi:ABC-2 type transport system permease protein